MPHSSCKCMFSLPATLHYSLSWALWTSWKCVWTAACASGLLCTQAVLCCAVQETGLSWRSDTGAGSQAQLTHMEHKTLLGFLDSQPPAGAALDPASATWIPEQGTDYPHGQSLGVEKRMHPGEVQKYGSIRLIHVQQKLSHQTPGS